MSSSVAHTRRLHVSGLTPAISSDDLNARFAIFGNVKAIDRLGNLDALGQPRKFAFVSLEASTEKHAKCLNVLSGSTWKGAKLRIGEARLDYTEKLEKERLQEDEPKFKRRRLARGVHGVERKDMSITSLENMNMRSGWKRTALSHLVYPARMRPLHPIERPQNSSLTGSRKKKKKIKSITRARRQKIDPTRYGAVHMTEEMLQAEHIVIPKDTDASPRGSPVPEMVQPHRKQRETSIEAAQPKRKQQERPVETPQAGETAHTDVSPVDIYQAEKKKDLSLLAQLFDGRDEWTGKEDDIEEIKAMIEEGEYDEDVPMIIQPTAIDGEESSESEESETSEPSSVHEPDTALQAPTAVSLKDLFSTPAEAPRSILAGLDLDLSLDEDLAFDTVPLAEPVSASEPVRARPDEVKPQAKRHVLEGLQISTTIPYFFPLSPSEQSRGSVKDIMAVSQARGWMEAFLNPLTSDEIKRQWETEKVGLTRDWKQRHREATKRLRRGVAVET